MATGLTKIGGTKAPADEAGRHRAVLVRNGEYWTIGYRGSNFQLRDVKGLTYIQRLLGHPGAEFHALDLITQTNPDSLSDSARVERHESALPTGVTFRQGITGDAGEAL